MPLSAEEIATAKKAYSEMRACDNFRILCILISCFSLFFIILFGVFFACGMTADDHGKTIKGWGAFLSFLSHGWRPLFFCAIALLGQALTYRRLQPRYAENLKVVTALERQHAGELPYGLEEEFRREHPFLETLSRKLEKRAILWRLDAFLSRKAVSD